MGSNDFLRSRKKKMGTRNEERTGEPVQEKLDPVLIRRLESDGSARFRHRGRPELPARRRLPMLALLIAAATIVVVGSLVGILCYTNRGVEVIDLTNWEVSDARLWANGNGVNLQAEERYDDAIDSDHVISQSVAKGKSLRKGDFLSIKVSLGHDPSVELPLPDIMSMTKDDIGAWVEKNYMMMVSITAEYDNEVAAGRVIGYEIGDKSVVDKVRRDTPISIVVSKGREDEAVILVTVPNFRDMTVAECHAFASENGIVLTIDEQYDDYAPKGAVIAQSVNTDGKIKKGDEVVLTVSKGKKIFIPDFSAYGKDRAATVATGLNITVLIAERYSSQPTGEFLSQSAPTGSLYEEGDAVELVYSLGSTVVISNFVGKTRDTIETWAKGLNEQGASITINSTYTQSNKPKGQIITQDKSDMTIGITTTINITVSQGKAVFVPDFVAPKGSGYDVATTREEALSICTSLNIIPVFVEEKKTGRLPDEVWYQSIAAGTEVSEETIITLKYTPANVKVTVWDFTGMTESEIIAAGYLKKLDITFVTAISTVSGYAGKVYKQSLRAGITVAAGSAITLTVSPVPSPTASPTPTPTPTPTATP